MRASIERSSPSKPMPRSCVQQIVAREDAAGVAGEQPEQVEPGRGQVDGPPASVALRVCWLMRKLPEGDRLLLSWFSSPPAGAGRRSSALMASRDARRHRLGDVVVGAEFEAEDLVDVLVAGRQHQDDAFVAADGTADGESVLAGEHDVEQTRSGRVSRNACFGRVAAPFDGHG